MTDEKRYLNAASFLQALTHRFASLAKERGTSIDRLRRHVAFDCLLARLFDGQESPWVLKGGYALELRLGQARATKDLDLAFWDIKAKGETSFETVERYLQQALQCDLDDFFFFEIEKRLQALQGGEGGQRFLIRSTVSRKTFSRFHLDIVWGENAFEPLEKLSGGDWLAFAGISSTDYWVVRKEQQFSEKLHAYTRPRKSGFSSRVKDLVDLNLLIQTSALDPKSLAEAIEGTFGQRDSHPLPRVLPDPPSNWGKPFAHLAQDCDLELDLATGFEQVKAFVESLPLPSRGTK